MQAKYGGWKYYYSRLSSAASLKVLCKLGAEVMAEVEFDGEKLWMVRVDFSKTYPSYTMLKSMLSAAKQNAKLWLIISHFLSFLLNYFHKDSSVSIIDI